MQLDNRQAIFLLICLELSVELSSDIIREQASKLPWPVFSKTVSDGLVCLVLMALIITAIAMIEPEPIEIYYQKFWRKIRVFYRVIKTRLKRKKTA